MCGISGFYHRNKIENNSRYYARMGKMLDQIIHRGPDDYGKHFFTAGEFHEADPKKTEVELPIVENSCLGLGHRRLSIIDTSSAGRQPIESHDKELVMVFNGEIYNYLELKAELDYPWQTKTDSEVILAAYKKWGMQMMERFDGMFAFVILDKNKRKLLGARDVAGIKPLYYSCDKNAFYFASEPHALLAGKTQARSYDATHLSEFLLLGVSDHDTGTMLQGVSQIKGGFAFEYDLNNCKLETYPYHSFKKEVQDCMDEKFWESLQSSFSRQLRSDVKLGTSLSGGIDSSGIASVIGKLIPKEQSYNALTFTSTNFEDDESELAKIVAKNAGLNWVAVQPESEDLKSGIIHMIKNMGEPFSSLSMFAQYQVMKKANELGIKVMLDGQGGDELYLGYPRMAMRVMMHYLKSGRVKSFISELNGLKTNLSIPYKTSILGNIYHNSKNIAIARRKAQLTQFIEEDYLNNYRDDVAKDVYAGKPVLEKQADEFYKYCLPRLLRYADRNSMAFSVESRVPHLANPMIDIGLSLPIEKKVKNGWTKYILRQSLQGTVPDEILWSKVKRGFGVPQSYWVNQISEELKKWVNGLPEDSPIKKEMILESIEKQPGNTILWPVLSAIALNQLSDIKF